MIKGIDVDDVATYDDTLGQIRELTSQLIEAGLNRTDAYNAVYDAYQLGYSRADTIWRQMARDEA